jgi:hypothetical protein
VEGEQQFEGEERKIGDFLVELSEDAKRLGQFQQSPEDVLAGSGLSERQKEVLRSGDIRRIREAVAAEYPDQRLMVIVGIQFW